MKKCPMCSEDIQDEAIKCKHCGSDLHTVGKERKIEDFISFFHGKTGNVYSIKSKDYQSGKVVMEKDGSAFSAGLCFVLFLFFIVPGFIYLITTYGKKYTITIRFDDNGIVSGIHGKNFINIIQDYKA